MAGVKGKSNERQQEVQNPISQPSLPVLHWKYFKEASDRGEMGWTRVVNPDTLLEKRISSKSESESDSEHPTENSRAHLQTPGEPVCCGRVGLSFAVR